MLTSQIMDAFRAAKDTVHWANEAIAELQVAGTLFFQGDFAEIVTDFDHETAENVRKLRIKKSVPHTFNRKTVEAINNLRHSFDQATYAAVAIISGRDGKNSIYPWSKNPTDLDTLLKQKNRGIDKCLWDTFRKHQPYPRGNGYAGGDDVLRALARLANNKHTVGLEIGGQFSSGRMPGFTHSGVKSIRVMPPRWDSKKNEIELVRWAGGEMKFENDEIFRLEIVLRDPVLPHPVNIIEALTRFAVKANSVIETLQASCIEQRAADP